MALETKAIGLHTLYIKTKHEVSFAASHNNVTITYAPTSLA